MSSTTIYTCKVTPETLSLSRTLLINTSESVSRIRHLEPCDFTIYLKVNWPDKVRDLISTAVLVSG